MMTPKDKLLLRDLKNLRAVLKAMDMPGWAHVAYRAARELRTTNKTVLTSRAKQYNMLSSR